MTTKQPQDLINDRQKTHGSFEENARVSQCIKQVYNSNPNYKTLSHVYRESLEMIALKISRILSGMSHEQDHWDDIAGYAKLASNYALSQIVSRPFTPKLQSAARAGLSDRVVPSTAPVNPAPSKEEIQKMAAEEDAHNRNLFDRSNFSSGIPGDGEMSKGYNND